MVNIEPSPPRAFVEHFRRGTTCGHAKWRAVGAVDAKVTMQPEWDNWLERLYNLRRDKSGPHDRPDKSVLLPRILDGLDCGILMDGDVPLPDKLIATFKRHFEEKDDKFACETH